MTNFLRQFARKHLPPGARKVLGNGYFLMLKYLVDPVQGAYFDWFIRRFKTDGCQFEIPKNLTSRSYRACFVNDSYEAEERELIRNFVRPEDTVLEMGGCIGIVSCVTNKLLKDNTRHVVVEGNPMCMPSLHRNRNLNNCGFLVENCAVSNETDVTFYLHPVYIVGGTTQRSTALPVRMPGRSLKELDARYGPFSVLVMDIEGSELDIFTPAIDVLKKYRLIIVELHPWAIGEEGVQKCRDIMSSVGFTFKQRAGITEAWQRD